MNILKRLVPKQSSEYPEIVTQIHHEFEIASDVLMAECEAALKALKNAPAEKVELLSSLGFINTKEVIESKQIESKKQVSQQMIDLVQYYKLNYPNNKFITNDQVTAICEKYNLVCGDVSRYTGFVPEAQLQRIAAFTLKEDDYSSVYKYGHDSLTHHEWMQEHRRYFVESCVIERARIVARKKERLQICAPLKDMDTKGMKVENRRLVREIPDPVVLQPVRGGYLILAAWGDEASDPIVVNETMN